MSGARRILGNADSSLIEVSDLQFRLRISGACRFLIPISCQFQILRNAAASEVVAGEFDLLVNVARLGRNRSGGGNVRLGSRARQ